MHKHRSEASQARVHHSQLTTATDGEPAGSVDTYKHTQVAHTHTETKKTRIKIHTVDTVQRFRCEMKEEAGEDEGISVWSERCHKHKAGCLMKANVFL